MTAGAFDMLRAARALELPPPPPKLTGTDKLVLVMLVMRADKNGRSWPAYTTLARDTWLSVRAVKTSIARLSAAKIVHVEQRTIEGSRERDSNRYTVRIGVVQQVHDVVHDEHHVVQQPHDGGAPDAQQVVRQVHEGGAPSAQEVLREVPIEVPIGSTQGSDGAAAPPLLTHPSSASTPKKARAAKHTPEEIAAKTELVDHFIAGVETKKGCKPETFNGGDHAAAFALAKKYGIGEAKVIVSRALDDDFVLSRNCTLRYIASKPDSWRGTARTKANGMAQVVPISGRAYAMPRDA